MTALDANKLSMLALAHVGDAVYELLTRTMLCTRANSSVAQLHKQTVSYVNAPAQARAAEKILPLLDAEEASVYRRGRSIPCRTTQISGGTTPRQGLRHCSAGCICRGGRSAWRSFSAR